MDFSISKQKLLLENLISNPDIFTITSPIIKAKYFDPELRRAVKYILKYYDEYHSTPSPELVNCEADTDLTIKEPKLDEIEWTKKELEKFCKFRAFRDVMLEAPKFMEEGDYDTIMEKAKEALLISLQRDLGLRYFDTVEERLARLLVKQHIVPTGWDELDFEILPGGIGRGEVILFAGGSGGGKSISLANLSLNFAERGLNTLYISLELSPDVIAQRFDTMITGVSNKIFRDHIDHIVVEVDKYKSGKGIIDIHQMKSGSKSNQMVSYLKEYQLKYNLIPDLLVVDYLDLMAPNSKEGIDGVFEKDKRCSEELRNIGVDYNCCIATASQLNRTAVDVEILNHSHIAGGISKINTADVFIAILLDRDKREMEFQALKTRNSDGVGRIVRLNWDSPYLRIRNMDDKNGIVFVPSAKDAEYMSSRNSQMNIDDLLM